MDLPEEGASFRQRDLRSEQAVAVVEVLRRTDLWWSLVAGAGEEPEQMNQDPDRLAEREELPPRTDLWWEPEVAEAAEAEKMNRASDRLAEREEILLQTDLE